MKNKKYSVFITALFCLFVYGFGIFFFAAPDKDFSEKENRFLAQFKAPSWSTLVSGEFMEDFEDYVVDQFPLRDEWINLKAWGERLLGKHENNKVYFGTDGQTLFAHFNALSDEELAKRVDYVNKFAEKAGVPVYFSIIPDKSFVWADRLPNNAPNVDDGSTIPNAMTLVSDKVNFIDLRNALNIVANDPFYRTDHHWTTFGAYRGYIALMNAMGISFNPPKGEPVQVSDSFCGTTWSSAGASWITPDAIHTWIDENSVTVDRYSGTQAVKGQLYDESFLEKKDKYSMFLGGNQPLCVLRNENATTDQKLLVIRDSYCDSLAPFLAQDFAEVHLFDLRYTKTPLPQYIADNGIDQALVLYSAANFTTDTNLFLMGLG